MATIRDVVQALGGREGVDAVIVHGHDGVTIDSRTDADVDPAAVAALVPTVVDGCNRFGSAAGRGRFGTGLVEFANGLAIITEVTADTLLTILVKRGSNVGTLLYELRRHRAAIADLL